MEQTEITETLVTTTHTVAQGCTVGSFLFHCLQISHLDPVAIAALRQAQLLSPVLAVHAVPATVQISSGLGGGAP